MVSFEDRFPLPAKAQVGMALAGSGQRAAVFFIIWTVMDKNLRLCPLLVGVP